MPRPPPPGAATISSGGSMIGLRQGFEILSEIFPNLQEWLKLSKRMTALCVHVCACACVRVCVYVVCVCVNNLTSLKKKNESKSKTTKPPTPQFGSILFCSEVSHNSCTKFIKHVQLWVKYFFSSKSTTTLQD